MAVNQDELNKLLDLEGPKDPPEDGAPAKSDPPPEDPKAEELKSKLGEVENKNKDLEEKVRQLAETNKGITEVFDKLTGADKKKEALAAAQQRLKDHEEDPMKTVDQVAELQETVKTLRTEVVKTQKTNEVDRIMREIDNDYDVDWDGKSKIIGEKLAKFDQAEKDKDLKGCVIEACLLARSITKRETPGFIPEHTRNGVTPKATQSEIESETKKVNERLNKFGKKKQKKNILGI